MAIVASSELHELKQCLYYVHVYMWNVSIGKMDKKRKSKLCT